MKNRANLWALGAVVLSLVACEKKEEIKVPAPAAPRVVEQATPAIPDTPVTPVTPATPATPAVKAAALSPEKRAAALGFAQYLPPETEVVMAFHNGLKSADRITSSKLWKLIQAETGMGMEQGMEPLEPEPAGAMEPADNAALPAADAPAAAKEQDAPADAAKEPAAARDVEVQATPEADASPSGVGVLLGKEFTIALGKSAGEQTANLLAMSRRMNYIQMRLLAKAFAAAAKAEDLSTMEQTLSEQYGPELFKELLADPESGVALIERMQMPPLYLAFRTTAADRAAAVQQLAGLVEYLAMLGDMVEPVEVEVAGQKFAGRKIVGAKIVPAMEAARADMESVMEPAMVDKLLAAVAKKNLVVVNGLETAFSAITSSCSSGPQWRICK